MEWIILFLLIPAVLVPVIMLCGFAGCDRVFGITEVGPTDPPPPDPVPPARPTMLTGKATGATSVELSWENSDVNAVRFGVFRGLLGDPLALINDQVTATPYPDSAGLLAGETYLYAVTAISAENQSSEQSNIVTVSLAFRTAFAADLTVNDTGRRGFCVIQKIGAFNPSDPANPANLANVPGSILRLSIRGTANLQIDRIFVSQPALPSAANPQPDPWDAAPDLKQVASAVTLMANTATPLPDVAYLLDPSKDLLVAFDIAPAAGSGNLRFAAVPGATAYLRDATAEAGLSGGDRSPDYQEIPDQVYLVAKIEVL